MYDKPILGIFHLYGVMIAVGILCCFLLLFYYGKKRKINSKFIDFVFYNAIASIAFGFFSAALFQATYNYIENPAGGFDLGGGVTFIGGLIGGVVTFLVIYFAFRKKLSGRVLDILSFAPCCITIAHGFGRIGCFFAGCCYGAETDSFLGVQFPDLPSPVHPTQLYEAVFLFLLCAVVFLLVMKWKFKHGMSVYLISYGIFRFLIEYLRDDHRGGFIPGISPSQFWSILMVVLGIGLIFLVEYLWKKRRQTEVVEAVASSVEETTETTVEEKSEDTEAQQ
ncbi:MAG: prolipoprotein diacylglyceryl transferase [Clostridia bacterium]|nr:prolipoprotein diacylglyceryl transferase [Clostridia bacterium]